MPTDYTPTPAPLTDVQVPSDGDADEAAAWNPAIEALADAIAYTRLAKPVAEGSQTYDEAGDPPYADSNSTNGTAYSAPFGCTLPDLTEGDVVEVSCVVSMAFDDGAVGAYGVLRLTCAADGGAFAVISGAKFAMGADVVVPRCIAFRGRYTVPAPGIPGDPVSIEVRLEWKVTNAAALLHLNGPYSLRLVAFRYNS